MKNIVYILLFIAQSNCFAQNNSNTIFKKIETETKNDSLLIFWDFDTRTVDYFRIEISDDGIFFKKIGENIDFVKDKQTYNTAIRINKSLFVFNSFFIFILLISFYKKTYMRKIMYIFFITITLLSCQKKSLEETKEVSSKKIFLRIVGVNNNDFCYSYIKIAYLTPPTQ